MTNNIPIEILKSEMPNLARIFLHPFRAHHPMHIYLRESPLNTLELYFFNYADDLSLKAFQKLMHAA